VEEHQPSAPQLLFAPSPAEKFRGCFFKKSFLKNKPTALKK
jgi:hypothetical protein